MDEKADFEAVLNLLAVIADPKTAQERLADLRAAITDAQQMLTAAREQAAVNERRGQELAAMEQKLVNDAAEHTRRSQELDVREHDLLAREARLRE